MSERRDSDEPRFATNRRRLLLGLGAMGGGALASSVVHAQSTQDNKSVTAAPSSDATDERVDYLGLHQAGIVNPRPLAGMVASFNVLARSPADLERLFRTLTQRIAFLTQGGTAPTPDPGLPPPDSGLLGPVVAPGNLTMTIAVGDSLFDDRFGLAGVKPKRLKRMSKFPNDALDAAICHGDLAIQFCANSADINMHALRDLIKQLPDLLLLRWQQEGSVPPVPAGVSPKPSARNFLGFRDGSANPDTSDPELMGRIVWTRAGGDEPAWVDGGSYQVVRIIRNFVERWDRTPLNEQQRLIGREKASGAPLDGQLEHDVPNFAADPEGKITSLAAHIRRANPRTAETQGSLILRRPFNYSNGVARNGQLDQGLLFICFQADLEAGFVTVQNRLSGELLEEYIKPVGGGFFFVLPGIAAPDDFFGRTMLEAAGLMPKA